MRRAADYARDRIVFGRPIGQNQGIQQPPTLNWIALESAFYAGLRESVIAKIAPVTEQPILSNIAERVLKLPKSY